MGLHEVDPISASHALFKERYVPVDHEVSLRVVSWEPRAAEPSCPIVFVPGWVSIVAGWADLLHELTRVHPVFYIETREKNTARITRRRLRARDFSVDRFAEDLVTVCSSLPISGEETLFSGSSLGATVLLEALKCGGLKAKGAFLVGPATEFRIPRSLYWVPYLLPAFTYHLVKHFVVWYFRRFRIDVEKEPEQMRRYERTILSANPVRIKLSARAFMHYRIGPELEKVPVPIRIAYASTDKLHASEAMTRLAEMLPRADRLPCESNKYMHSASLAGDIERFLADLEGGSLGTEARRNRSSACPIDRQGLSLEEATA